MATPAELRSRAVSTGWLDDCYSRSRFAALILLCLVLLFLRKPDALTNPQLVAEDGVVFFREQLLLGWRALLVPYAGYQCLLSRLIALACAPLPVYWAPLGYAVLAGLVQASACAFFFVPANRFLLRSDFLRALVCLVVVAAGPSETLLLTACNVQWPLFAAGLLILAHDWRGETVGKPRATLAYACAAAVIALSSSLLALFVVPFGIWTLARRRRPLRWVTAVFVLACLVQVASFLLTAPEAPGHGPLPGDSVAASAMRTAYATAVSFVYRSVIGIAAGEGPARALADRAAPVPVLLGASLLLLPALAWLLRRSDRTRRLVIGCALLATVVSIAPPLVLRGLMPYFGNYSGPFTLWGCTRYFLLGASVFVWLVALGLECRFPVGWAKYSLLLLAFASGILHNFAAEPYQDFRWREQAARIETWRRARFHQYPRPAPITVHVPPAGWEFRLE